MKALIGRRTLGILAVVAALAVASAWADAARERARRHALERVPLARTQPFEPEQVVRVDLTLGDGADGTWSYERRDGVFRIPGHRDAYALAQNLEGVQRALIEGRGNRMGRYPAEAARFGLGEGTARRARIELRDAAGQLLLGAIAGHVAPGDHGLECYVAQDGQPHVLLLDTNPWPSLGERPDPRLPPLIDTHVRPLALRRGVTTRLELTPPQSGLRALVRTELPPDPNQPGPMRGPRTGWSGLFEGENEPRPLHPRFTGHYIVAVENLAFDELAGPAASERGRLGTPALTIVLHTDAEGTAETLILGERLANGVHAVHASGTDQITLLSSEIASILFPDLATLQAPDRP